jgi:AGZA family xanthine/uracil permease-like MFS transporter
LTSVVVGCRFLLSMFFTRLALLVPAHATAPALIIVGFLMISAIREIDWSDASIDIPVMLAILVIPLTYSIPEGSASDLSPMSF